MTGAAVSLGQRFSAAAFALAAVVGLSFGCTSVDGAVKKDGPKAKANLAKIAPLAADLATRAPVVRDEVAPPDTKVVFDASYPDEATAALMYAEDLGALGELGNVYARVAGSKRISECASLLDHQTFPWDPQDTQRWNAAVDGFEVQSTLRTCGRIRTLFVLRTMDLVKPGGARVEPTDAGATSAVPASSADENTCRPGNVRCSFQGGYVKIEVHVFSLEPFAHKGAFVIEAESSPSVKLAGSRTDDALEADLGHAVGTAFSAAATRLVPGASVKGLP